MVQDGWYKHLEVEFDDTYAFEIGQDGVGGAWKFWREEQTSDDYVAGVDETKFCDLEVLDIDSANGSKPRSGSYGRSAVSHRERPTRYDTWGPTTVGCSDTRCLGFVYGIASSDAVQEKK